MTWPLPHQDFLLLTMSISEIKVWFQARGQFLVLRFCDLAPELSWLVLLLNVQNRQKSRFLSRCAEVVPQELLSSKKTCQE